MLQRFLIIWLVLLSAVAYFWPLLETAAPWLGDPLAGGGPFLPYLIVITMFCIGAMLPRDEVRQVARRWPMVFAGVGLQYLAMPALAYAMARLWGIEGDLLVGMVVVGCVPGAMASNVLTLLARGNASYSVSLTTLATLVSPLAVPLALRFCLSASGDGIDDGFFLSLAFKLLWMVVAPVIFGQALARLWPAWESAAGRMGSNIANLAILLIIAVVVAGSREKLAELRADLFLALLGVNLAGYAVGYAGGAGLRLPESMRRALTLEVGMQNAGLGATLALQIFPDQPDAAIPPALYTFGCMFTGAVLARAWATWGAEKQLDAELSEDS